MAYKKGMKQRGKLSQELIHRIDTMNDEDDLESQPYVARKKKDLDTEQLFDSRLYSSEDDNDYENNDNEEDTEKKPKGTVIAVTLSITLLLGVIVFVLVNIS